MIILRVTVRTGFDIMCIKACTARWTAHSRKRKAKLGRLFQPLSHAHMELVGRVYYPAICVVKTVKEKCGFNIAHIAVYLAAVHIQVEDIRLDYIGSFFGALTIAAGKLRGVIAVSRHSE